MSSGGMSEWRIAKGKYHYICCKIATPIIIAHITKKSNPFLEIFAKNLLSYALFSHLHL